jgi:hypothetical protein
VSVSSPNTTFQYLQGGLFVRAAATTNRRRDPNDEAHNVEWEPPEPGTVGAPSSTFSVSYDAKTGAFQSLTIQFVDGKEIKESRKAYLAISESWALDEVCKSVPSFQVLFAPPPMLFAAPNLRWAVSFPTMPDQRWLLPDNAQWSVRSMQEGVIEVVPYLP